MHFFLFHWFSQVVTNFTFNLEPSVRLLILKCLPFNATKKLLVKIVEHKLESAFFDGIKTDVQLGASFCSVSQFVMYFPDLPVFTSFVFSNNR